MDWKELITSAHVSEPLKNLKQLSFILYLIEFHTLLFNPIETLPDIITFESIIIPCMAKLLYIEKKNIIIRFLKVPIYDLHNLFSSFVEVCARVSGKRFQFNSCLLDMLFFRKTHLVYFIQCQRVWSNMEMYFSSV